MPVWKQILSPTQPVDPYFEWANETNFADLFAAREQRPADERWFPVIIELSKDQSVNGFAKGEWRGAAKGLPNIAIPDIYAHLGNWARTTRYCTAMVRKPFLDELRVSESLRKVINRVEIGRPLRSEHKPTKWTGIEARKVQGPKVVIGVMDDGLAFGHELFRRQPTQTRIEYFWNQDGQPPVPPAGFLEGWDLAKEGTGAIKGIDDYLRDCSYLNSVDEDQLYAVTHHAEFTRTGHKPVARRAAHGTHVMHLAAGYPLKDAPSDRPIVCVQLPVATTSETSGATLAYYVLNGLHYIIERANSLGARPPAIVVNLSYGLIAGPHNGTSIIEAAVDELVGLRSVVAPLRVVLPAGNNHLSRCHACFCLDGDAQEPTAGQQTLRWRILPDDATPSFMEIWLPDPTCVTAVCEVSVTTPAGLATPQPIQEGEEWVLQEGNEVLCKVFYLTSTAPGRTRKMIFIAVAPTATDDAVRRIAPSGEWRITVRKKDAGRAIIDAWIQRDDTPFGYPLRSRQSRFEDDERNYPYWDNAGREVDYDGASYIQRGGSINAISTGCRSIVVAGFRRSDWTPAKHSAGGPVIHPPGRGMPVDEGPEAMAVSDDSPAHRGVLGAGTRTGSITAMNGTSVAAPQITRWVADELAARRAGDRQAVFDLARSGTNAPPKARTEATPPPGAPATPAAERGGGGRVAFFPLVQVER